MQNLCFGANGHFKFKYGNSMLRMLCKSTDRHIVSGNTIDIFLFNFK